MSQSKRKAVICDIDGTVALHGPERGHYDYHLVATDQPNQPVIDIVNALVKDFDIIFVSGRMLHSYGITAAWLQTYVGGWTGACELYMRPDGDHRKDTIVKREIYDNHIVDRYDIVCALDDRDQVVDMWRGLKLVCLQVAPGNF